jgi:hypothetical protein
MKVIKNDKLVSDILELINEFKDDTALQNALKEKDMSLLIDIMLHRYNMSMHLYGFDLYYLTIKGMNYDKMDIFFDKELNIKSAYYYADDKEYSLNIKELESEV